VSGHRSTGGPRFAGQRLLVVLMALLVSVMGTAPAAAATSTKAGIRATPEAVPAGAATDVVIAGTGFADCLQASPSGSTPTPSGNGAVAEPGPPSGGVRIRWNGREEVEVPPEGLVEGGFTRTIPVTPDSGASSVGVEATCVAVDPNDSASPAFDVYAEATLQVIITTPPATTVPPITNRSTTVPSTARLTTAAPVTDGPSIGVSSPGGDPPGGASTGDTSKPVDDRSLKTSGPDPLGVVVLLAVVAALVGLTVLRKRRHVARVGRTGPQLRAAPRPPPRPTVQAVAVVHGPGAIRVRRIGSAADLALRVVLCPDAGKLKVIRSDGGIRL